MSDVNHPPHYNAHGPLDADGSAQYEAIKVIEDWGLGFCLGNALKYICRAPHKRKVREDLEKALWYIERGIEHPEVVRMKSARKIPHGTVSAAWGLPNLLAYAVAMLYDGEVEEAGETLRSYLEDAKALP